MRLKASPTSTLIASFSHLIQQQLVGVDDDLAQEKFKNLETISVNLLSGIFEVVDPKKRWSLFQPFIPKVQKIFPLAEKRKVLNIIDMFYCKCLETVPMYPRGRALHPWFRQKP